MEDEYKDYHDNMSKEIREEISTFYMKNGEIYRSVISRMVMLVFNWLFALNSTALTLTVTLLGHSIISSSRQNYINRPIIVALALFALGLLTIFVSAYLEPKRFINMGKYLDSQFTMFQKNEIKGTEFIERITKHTPRFTWWVNSLEVFSIICFILGMISVSKFIYSINPF